MIGDMILDPGALQGRDRNEPQNRRVLSVVGRVFNPLDREDTLALILEPRDSHSGDEGFL